MGRILAVVAGLMILVSAGERAIAQIDVGVASADITGPKGYRMSGYFNERLNTGTHDPLYAKAIVFKQGDVKAALVFCDLIGLSANVSSAARKIASEKTGIPVDHIVIAATHSHTGPLYEGALRDYFHARTVAKLGNDPQEEVDYPKLLTEKLVEAIVAADKAAAPALLSAGIAKQEGISFNRRFHMKDGSVVFNPGKMNPDIVRVAGPIDPDVGQLLVRGGDGEPVASVTVFPLHLDTVSGTEYSGDYPHYLEKILRQDRGEKFLSLFAAGTCGDINHIDVSHDRKQGGQDYAKYLGETLGKTVAEAKLARIDKPSLAVKRAVVKAPLQKYDDEQVAWAKKQMENVGTRNLPFLLQVEATKILGLQMCRDKHGDTIPIEVQAFRISDDVAVVTLPGEVFVELGLAIKNASPFKTTMVMELCNDSPGYIPTEKAFKEGSYETVNSVVKTGGGEMMVEAAVKLLKQLKQ
jgi:hypothetical protein